LVRFPYFPRNFCDFPGLVWFPCNFCVFPGFSWCFCDFHAISGRIPCEFRVNSVWFPCEFRVNSRNPVRIPCEFTEFRVISVRFQYFPRNFCVFSWPTWFSCGFRMFFRDLCAASMRIPCEFRVNSQFRVKSGWIHGIPCEFTEFRVNSMWIRCEFRVFSVQFLRVSMTFVILVRFSTKFRSNSVSFLCFSEIFVNSVWIHGIPCEFGSFSLLFLWFSCFSCDFWQNSV